MIVSASRTRITPSVPACHRLLCNTIGIHRTSKDPVLAFAFDYRIDFRAHPRIQTVVKMALYPVVSWGLVLLLGGIAVYIYKPELIKKGLLATTTPAHPSTSSSKSANKRPKSKKPKAMQDVLDSMAGALPSSSEETRAKKKRKITAPVDQTVTITTTKAESKQLPRDVNNDIDDKAFAQMLAKAQAGTQLQSTSQKKLGASGLTTTALQPKKSEEILSTAELSSTTGQDADDDLSSVELPQPRTTSSRDISDMLEAPAAAPTTLRLTNVSGEPKKTKQAPKQFEQVQSKKKRNEQARREEQKRLREESDKIHEQKKQEQLRRARMAAGTSNQTKANAFTGSTNAWQNKTQAGDGSQLDMKAVPLLDTFDPSGAPSGAPNSVQAGALSTKVPTNNATSLKTQVGGGAASALAASDREQGTSDDWAGRMSEEEQMRKLRDQERDDAWESVTSKKSKKKNKMENDTSSEASFSVSQPVEARAENTTIKPSTSGTNGVKQPTESKSNRFDTIQPVSMGGLQDDEWAA